MFRPRRGAALSWCHQVEHASSAKRRTAPAAEELEAPGLVLILEAASESESKQRAPCQRTDTASRTLQETCRWYLQIHVAQ